MDLVVIMAEKVRFGAVDFTVFAVMLLLSAIIGIYHAFTGGRQRTTKEFLFANRGMMGIPVALSLLASFMSAITILGVPSEMYIYGTQYWLIIASYVILFPAVALVFVPVFRAVEISSSYEVGSRCSCTELYRVEMTEPRVCCFMKTNSLILVSCQGGLLSKIFPFFRLFTTCIFLFFASDLSINF